MIEVTHSCQVHKKDFMDYINNKHHLTEELEWAKKLNSEKAWTLTAKASSLKIELKAAQEKIQILEESLAWSSNRTEYG